MDKHMIEQRLAELKRNQVQGEQQLQKLETQKRELQATLQRISGAITVLEELLDSPDTPD
ncbi:hypothetical protein [Janthinobacterium sp.]|uniref:hypothetical protein n=1 Tax=Janthinobacterium sp. TaxID=1871054 RepID=UPI0026160F65|nr:hypothetical protein [Janthinobacterium sp.]